MKNVTESQLKTCIFFLRDDFERIINSFGFSMDVSLDGISFGDLEEIEDVYDEDVYGVLSDYFDVEVTSVHCDDCDYTGIWVVYKNKSNFNEVQNEI